MTMKTYGDIRKDIRSGDILGWSHRGWKSWRDIKIAIVRIWRKSEYSHVGTAWVVGNRVFVLEAVEPCARIYPLSKLGNFYWLPMGAPWIPETEELALSHIGDDYKQLTAIKANFQSIEKGGAEECAAYVLTVAASEGINLGDRAIPDCIIYEAQKLGVPCYLVVNE